MKNILTILITIFSLISLNAQVQSQETESATFQSDMIHVLDNLDFSEVTSGFFYDKAYPFFPIKKFDGSVNSHAVRYNPNDNQKENCLCKLKVYKQQKVADLVRQFTSPWGQ